MIEDSRVLALARRARHPAFALAGLAFFLACCSSGHVEQSESSKTPDTAARPAQPAPQRGPTIRVLARESSPLVAVEGVKARHEARTGVRVEIVTRARMQDVLTEVDRELASARGTGCAMPRVGRRHPIGCRVRLQR